ncbi:MAG: DUF2384 domain-containing protein [Gammaproteobacteria bacterium]|nr:DUF2384 domain-containing protein [Gammaproteobacteria bacterium]
MTERQTEDARMKMTRYVMGLLESWELNAEQQVGVLALPDGTRTRVLRSFRDDTPLPDTDDVNQRLEHILAIDDALHTTYPHSEKMGALWMRRGHRRFKQRTPVNTIIEDGLQGLVSVRMHLDCSWMSSP